ncbi:uncharacterized protein UV8b_07701 [Ustilaginoidea virens]|uniref:Uncharacterized protein n=1 Tax=Ustilaginoidea virens TaxID=1159556 RepID=A0A8E5HY00_USTVR|nr:uncharacterized protein UV8b_07701 [Ustilaginoidea virens]QUC23460.1 hypothetical protein UV8b_07701 [Ustilaginoidea virens]
MSWCEKPNRGALDVTSQFCGATRDQKRTHSLAMMDRKKAQRSIRLYTMNSRGPGIAGMVHIHHSVKPSVPCHHLLAKPASSCLASPKRDVATNRADHELHDGIMRKDLRNQAPFGASAYGMLRTEESLGKASVKWWENMEMTTGGNMSAQTNTTQLGDPNLADLFCGASA